MCVCEIYSFKGIHIQKRKKDGLEIILIDKIDFLLHFDLNSCN